MQYYKIETKHFDNWEGGGCRIYVNGDIARKCTAGGCGYDRNTTAIANWLMTLPEVQERITHKLANSGSMDKPTGFYGLSHCNSKTRKFQKRASKNTRSYIDGGCGQSSIFRLMKACKIDITWVAGTKNSNFYTVEVK